MYECLTPQRAQIVSNCPSAHLVKKMIAMGADVNAKAANGVTAIALANTVNCEPVAEALKKAGAK